MVLSRAVRLIEIELQSRFETLRFANRKACDVDAILLCSVIYSAIPPFSPISTALANCINAHHLKRVRSKVRQIKTKEKPM